MLMMKVTVAGEFLKFCPFTFDLFDRTDRSSGPDSILSVC